VLVHDIRGAGGVTVGTVKTVHVTVDKRTGRKMPLPDKLRAALQRI